MTRKKHRTPKRPKTGSRPDSDREDSGEIETLPDGSISVPVIEEEVALVRRPVVRERIIIRKTSVVEDRRVQAGVRRERIAVEHLDRAGGNTMQMLKDALGDKAEAFEDFTKKYDKGPPSEGYSENEVRDRYSEVASNMSPQQYEQAARQSFDRLSPEERQQFGQQLNEAASQQGLQLNPTGDQTRYEDSEQLAQMASQAHQEKPDLIQSLLGGGGGSAIKGGLAGIAANAVKKFF